MVFECKKSDGFAIKYEDTQYTGEAIIYLVTERSNPEYEEWHYVEAYNNEALSFELIRRQDSVQWAALGSCLFVAEGTEPIAVYWASLVVTQDFADFEIIRNPNGTLKLKGKTLTFEDEEGTRTQEQIKDLFAITKEDYDYYLENGKLPRASPGRRFLRDEMIQRGYSGITDVEITDAVVTKGSRWDIKIYLDGEYSDDVGINSLRASPYTEPPWRVESYTKPIKVTLEKEFEKQVDSQSTEVLSDAFLPNKYILYLVNIDSQGAETGRMSLLSFHTQPEDEPPWYEIVCDPSQEECPENTCAVDCGSHICCYGSDGISVFAYAK